ncbi:hypothetical protein NVP1089O_18 [Vibrio phage 1.089.O._10N.261.51.F9]|nr:hypothetical protein NVP1012O_18 [Vibrio phage 1.012.O._10N.261.48.C12]AUR86756.1 hypothetical protein NVP1089O_18 [Vibrio phage 1.089.O._10N.261.51.F9]AUR87262.1 hypothetical protein NVP1098O_18 [Vibrio phage 1.098.O._10N.286.51.B9]AUR91367.1 hypothetical protein NVP1160O_18 [Vibrio phage 1.160.O._10N.261.48.B11]
MNMKYEYCLHTWGGFYNEEHAKIHKLEAGFHYFDTVGERDEYLKQLRKIESELGAQYLATSEFEGFHCRIPVVCHRICEFEGKQYHTKDELPPCYGFSSAEHWMENKWYPGMNDYPLGEEFNYYDQGFKIVAEWVEGAFAVDTTSDEYFV